MKNILALALAVAVSTLLPNFAPAEEKFSPWVDAQGAITLPKDFRRWVHLGTFVVTDEKAPGYGVHDVYTQPRSVEAYKKTGKFPDGTVLVKEIRKVKSGAMTTGFANWAGEVLVWFVMVKDSRGRFPKNPIWGDGWGWALYKAEDPKKNLATDYKRDCLGCHIPAKDTDWVYVQGYPTLK